MPGTDAPILVLTESPSDATLIRRLLEGEFTNIRESTQPDKLVIDFERAPPAVIVLAYDTLEKSESHYLALYRLSSSIGTQRHRTIILCNKDNVGQTYDACCRRLFDDYVLFWPMNYDSRRLGMSIHLALRALEADQGVIPPSEPQKHIAKPCILIVDDDDFMCKLLARMLSGAGYDTMLAHSGAEVFLSLRESRPNLIVMDVLMPGMNGIDITRRLKANPSFAPIPLIIVTGNSESATVRDSLKAGAIDFIVKPVERDLFLRKIAQAMQGLHA
jgi:CheY-like chemotaxis protein